MLQRLADARWGSRLSPTQQQELRRLRGLLAATVPPPAPHTAPEVADAAGLSEREREVLERLAAGDSNKLIARAFNLSPHTVKRHVANILDKLGVDTRGQAAARWRDRRG